MPTSIPSSLEELQTLALRQVGRNLLLFQKIEGHLKNALATRDIETTLDGPRIDYEKRAQSIKKSMLGYLIEDYSTKVLKPSDELETDGQVDEEVRTEMRMVSTFYVTAPKEFIEVLRQDLQSLNYERNQLVHHLLPRWQPESMEKTQELLNYLDAQYAKALPIFEHLRNSERNQLAVIEWMASHEYQQFLELGWLQSSPIVNRLKDLAVQINRPDGWTYLSNAGQKISKSLPEDMRGLKEIYGFSTLRQVVIACDLFDVVEEPMAEGNSRTLYRLKVPH